MTVLARTHLTDRKNVHDAPRHPSKPRPLTEVFDPDPMSAGRYRSADLQDSRNSAVNNINPLDLRVSHRSAGFLQDSCKSA